MFRFSSSPRRRGYKPSGACIRRMLRPLGDERSGSPYIVKWGATRRASNCSLVK